MLTYTKDSHPHLPTCCRLFCPTYWPCNGPLRVIHSIYYWTCWSLIIQVADIDHRCEMDRTLSCPVGSVTDVQCIPHSLVNWRQFFFVRYGQDGQKNIVSIRRGKTSRGTHVTNKQRLQDEEEETFVPPAQRHRPLRSTSRLLMTKRRIMAQLIRETTSDEQHVSPSPNFLVCI